MSALKRCYISGMPWWLPVYIQSLKMKKLSNFLFLLLLTSVTVLGNPQTSPSSASEQIRLNLYAFFPDSSTYVLDGTLTRYSDSYSNAVDINDSRKMFNPGENISMPRSGYDLIVECRQTITDADTIFFRMWGMQKKSYRLEFIARNLNHPGLAGYLEDSYLHTSTEIQLDDTTRFTIKINNDAASYAQNRFRIIFKKVQVSVTPVPHYTTLNGTPFNSNILFTWNTINQNNVENYFVEKSSDGIHFSAIAAVPANASGIYNWTDHYPGDELTYYRVRNNTSNLRLDYSNVLKIKNNTTSGISLYPNPASPSNLNVRLTDQSPGVYHIVLVNSEGRTLANDDFTYNGGVFVKKLSIKVSLPAGLYHIQISDGKKTTVISVVF